jgi:MYXO-CTERM domain-containing protein
MRRPALVLSAATTLSLLPVLASADPSAGYHPYGPTGKITTLDLSAEGLARSRRIAAPTEQPDLSRLDPIMHGELAADPDGRQPRTSMPDGMVQRGSMVLPSAIDDGTLVVEPETIFAAADIPGNEYPRKHTLYLNFVGGMLTSGSDNSAEDKSTLARTGMYPAFTQGNTKAIAIAQAVQADFAPYGITVVYEARPEKVIPYTMQMMSGDWQDTNIDSAAGGVAPGADCGSLGQRHVVYTFENGSTVGMANTASQEAGHAYGLDHVLDCQSVMSYCAIGDGSFRNTCAGLCEAQCQGPNSAGCQLTHEMFCGEDSFQQNDAEEMAWMFGGNEPDMEPPTVEIQSPVDGDTFEAGVDIDFRAVVDDNYGGYGWQYLFTKDGEVIYDTPDYDREVDADYRAAVNLGDLEPGEYVFTIEVHDHFGHMATDTVTINVGAAADSGPSDTSDSDADADSGDEADADSGDEGDDETSATGVSAGGTGTDPAADSGCACSTARSDADQTSHQIGSAAALLALGGLIVRPGRRRRRAA